MDEVAGLAKAVAEPRDRIDVSIDNPVTADGIPRSPELPGRASPIVKFYAGCCEIHSAIQRRFF